MSDAEELAKAMGEYARATESLSSAAETLREALRDDPVNTSGNVNKIVMASPDSGERSAHRVEKVAYLFVGLLVACGVVIWQQSERIARLEERQEMHAAWAREESNILRGYVWTGKVPVANPYPKQEPKK